MDPNTPVEDQNLVDDNVAQAISDTAAVAPGTSVTPDDVAAEEQLVAPPADAPAVDATLPAPVQDVATAPVDDNLVAPPEPAVEDQSSATDAIESPAMEPEPEVAAESVEDDMTVADTGDETEVEEPVVPAPEPAPEEPVAEPVVDTPVIDTPSGGDEDLMDVKQKALEQLSPLVSHLDLPPEKKFDTYMEILRASDDKDLVQPAFDAAQAIDDEDKKAQALLDVVNEVNYLTQDHTKE